MPLEETRQPRPKGLISPPTDARVFSEQLAAPTDLADVVETLWRARWTLGDDAHHLRMLSAPSVNLVLETGRSRVVGVYRRVWTRTLEGQGRVHAAKLWPGAVPALLRMPASELVDQTLSWSEAPPTDGDSDEVMERLVQTLRQIRRPGTPEAVAIVRRAREDREMLRVEALAKVAGRSVRSLQRLFAEQVGLSPKAVIRRYRLQEAAQRIELGQAPDLTELAHALGYADQAHLGRDFKAAVGLSPRVFQERVGR